MAKSNKQSIKPWWKDMTVPGYAKLIFLAAAICFAIVDFVNETNTFNSLKLLAWLCLLVAVALDMKGVGHGKK